MKILNEKINLNEFYERLLKSKNAVLLLDYDGTLAPFEVERDQARMYPGLSEILDDLIAAGHTRVVIVSGRRAEELRGLLSLAHIPEIWGSHGNERLLPDGAHQLAKLSKAELDGLKVAAQWAAREGLTACMEGKPAGLAFHWRGLSDEDAHKIRTTIIDKWNPLREKYDLKLLEFDGGIEIKVSNRDKGNAVRRILAEEGDQAIVAYLGDDLTDEDAFKALPDSGLSILIRAELRETQADIWLKPPHELIEFLSKWNHIRQSHR